MKMERKDETVHSFLSVYAAIMANCLHSALCVCACSAVVCLSDLGRPRVHSLWLLKPAIALSSDASPPCINTQPRPLSALQQHHYPYRP
ncbi:hypothetical protein ACOMHN_036808 [Nucella lapillus]